MLQKPIHAFSEPLPGVSSFGKNYTPPPLSGSDGKEAAHKAGDPGLILGLGRSPGEGNGNPLQYCLENSTDRGDCLATVHGVPKSRTQLSDFHIHPLNSDRFPWHVLANEMYKWYVWLPKWSYKNQHTGQFLLAHHHHSSQVPSRGHHCSPYKGLHSVKQNHTWLVTTMQNQ